VTRALMTLRDWSYVPLITVCLEHKPEVKSSSAMAPRNSRRGSHNVWKCEHTWELCNTSFVPDAVLPPAGEILFPT